MLKCNLSTIHLTVLAYDLWCDTLRLMRDLLLLAIHPLVTFAKSLCPRGARAVAAESWLYVRATFGSDRRNALI